MSGPESPAAQTFLVPFGGPPRGNIACDMKTISVGVVESDYESFRKASKAQGRPIAQLIREAMAFYRQERLEQRTPLRDVPVLVGHRLVTGLPARGELYDEVFSRVIEREP